MTSLRVLHQSWAVLYLLIVCLILETTGGQDYGSDPFSLDLRLFPGTTPHELSVVVTATNNVDKCIPIKISIRDNPNIAYLSPPATYIACVCGENNFFWDIYVSANTVITGDAEVVPATDICTEDEDIFPATNYKRSTSREIFVTS